MLEEKNFPVLVTAKRKLREGEAGGVKPPLHLVDFQFDGRELWGLEKGPETKSRWEAMARSGKKVMQFLEGARYIAVVADRKVHFYPHKN